jgi:U4/U6.U5 tri-snRNP-associated protein 2
MRIYTKKIPPTDEEEKKKKKADSTDSEYEWKVTESPFIYLTAELPPPPLFKDEHHENIIPQVRERSLKIGNFNSYNFDVEY